MRLIIQVVKNDSGATAIEYGLMAAAVGFAVSAVIPILMNT